MNHPLRVAVADDEPIMQMYLQETLAEFGHTVVASAGDGQELLEQCREAPPDLVVTDIMMPRLDGFLAVKELCRDGLVPVVFITGYDERERAAQAESECVLVYLMKPVGEAELRKAIDTVMQRFRHFEHVHDEEPDLRKALANRVHVERAKTTLMKRLGVTDAEAFQHLQDLARAKHWTLLSAAMEVLTATEV